MMRAVSRAARRQVPLIIIAVLFPLLLAYGYEVLRLFSLFSNL